MSFKLRGLRAALAAGLAALVAACGGGSGQVEPFTPTRILAMGDEMSVILPDGRKHSINALQTGGAVNCAANPLWIQIIGTGFDLTFPECPGGATAPASRILATVGARAADIQTQVDAVFDSLTDTDLVTMLVGGNDVRELYAQYPARSEADITAELRQRGRAWGVQINRVALRGPAVLVATAPDYSLSPFGRAEKADPAKQDTDRAALLRRLTDAFNGAMRLEIINDGRLIGLVFTDLEIQTIDRFPGSFAFANTHQAACLSSVLLPDCNTTTLVTDADANRWLWADSVQLSPGGHNRLGIVAYSRARNNPF